MAKLEKLALREIALSRRSRLLEMLTLFSRKTKDHALRQADRDKRTHLCHQTRPFIPEPTDQRVAGFDETATPEGRRPGRGAQQERRFPATGSPNGLLGELQGPPRSQDEGDTDVAVES